MPPSTQKTTTKKTILHVDINSYFATILQQENPHLRGKPVGVIKDAGRSCLIATSKEAKKMGINTGDSKFDAKKIYPDIICIPAAFDRYLDTTRRMQKIFLDISPDVYIYSLDEAFIDITACRKNLYPDVNLLAKNIQKKIKDDLGEWVTCNVGIAHNRLLSKMASEVTAKGTVMEVTQENKDALLASTSFGDVCGVGYALSKKLRLFNINTPYQIRFIPEQDLESIVGPFWVKELIKIAYGEETHLMQQIDNKQPHMKSVGRSITGYRLYDNDKEITDVLKNLSLEVVDKIRRMNLSGRKLSISLYGQNKKWKNHITVKLPMSHSSEIIDHIENLFKEWPKDFKVIKFLVRLSLLEKNSQDQLLKDWQKNESIQKALDKINTKHGIFTVHPAAIPSKDELILPEITGFLGDREYYGL